MWMFAMSTISILHSSFCFADCPTILGVHYFYYFRDVVVAHWAEAPGSNSASPTMILMRCRIIVKSGKPTPEAITLTDSCL